jgi:hypothetical protein
VNEPHATDFCAKLKLDVRTLQFVQQVTDLMMGGQIGIAQLARSLGRNLGRGRAATAAHFASFVPG